MKHTPVKAAISLRAQVSTQTAAATSHPALCSCTQGMGPVRKPCLPSRPAFFAFKACLACLQGLPCLPSRPALLAFKACLMCLEGLPPFFTACLVTLSLGRKGTNIVTIAHHVVCTCQCTLQCHTDTWSFDGCHDVLPCVSAAAHIATCNNTCLRLTPLHCRAGQPRHASVQRVSLLSMRG